jgi:hypothetical protein
MISKWILSLLLLIAAVCLCGLSAAADRKIKTAIKPSSPAVSPTRQPEAATPTTAPPKTATIAPAAGEQINWQVIAGGGSRGISTSYIVSGTIGQTAAGPGASTGYKANHGFWQNFATGGCCTGTTGNVNMAGIVDLADLSALVSYLTGGGYVLPCVAEANVNNSGIVDLADLSALVSYLTGGGYVLPSCP